MIIHELEISKLFVVFNRRYSFKEFYEASQVIAGSYADELVGRIYQCLFGNIREVLPEYEKYYALEYSSLASFLYWKYQINDELAEEIEKKLEDSTFMGFTRDTIHMFNDETVILMLKNILSSLGETIDEDSI